MAAAAAGREIPLPQTRASAPCPHVADAMASARAIGPVLPAVPTPSVSRMNTLAARTASAGITGNFVATTWSAKALMASIFPPPDDGSPMKQRWEQRERFISYRAALGALIPSRPLFGEVGQQVARRRGVSAQVAREQRRMAQGERCVVADQVPHGEQRNRRAHRPEIPVPQTLVVRVRVKPADHQTVPQAAQGQPALSGS